MRVIRARLFWRPGRALMGLTDDGDHLIGVVGHADQRELRRTDIGLRAYDAVQLSAALAVRRVDESCTEFAAFDRSLRTAAATEGFELMPSDLPDPKTA